MKRERLGVNNILPVVSCLSGNVIKTVYENNWMKPHDMSIGLALYPLSMKSGYWLTKAGGLSVSGWNQLPVPYVVSTSFQEVVGGMAGNAAHEVWQCFCCPSCWFWESFVCSALHESLPEQHQKCFLMFGKWTTGCREKMCEYDITEEPCMLCSTHWLEGNCREG